MGGLACVPMARRRGSGKRTCIVEGCDEPARRSLAYGKVKKALSDYTLAEGRRAHLCKDHDKEYKKATKVDRTLDRLTW